MLNEFFPRPSVIQKGCLAPRRIDLSPTYSSIRLFSHQLRHTLPDYLSWTGFHPTYLNGSWFLVSVFLEELKDLGADAALRPVLDRPGDVLALYLWRKQIMQSSFPITKECIKFIWIALYKERKRINITKAGIKSIKSFSYTSLSPGKETKSLPFTYQGDNYDFCYSLKKQFNLFIITILILLSLWHDAEF